MNSSNQFYYHQHLLLPHPFDLFDQMFDLSRALSFSHAVSASDTMTPVVSAHNHAMIPLISSTQLRPMFPYEIYSDKYSYHVKFSLPGVPPQNVSMEFDYESNELSVSGTMESNLPSKVKKSKFSRCIQFPPNVKFNESQTTANWVYGVLDITLYRSTPLHSRSKKIAINAVDHHGNVVSGNSKQLATSDETVREIAPKAIAPPPGMMPGVDAELASLYPKPSRPASIRSIPISLKSKSSSRSHTTVHEAYAAAPDAMSIRSSRTAKSAKSAKSAASNVSRSPAAADVMSLRSARSVSSSRSIETVIPNGPYLASSNPPNDDSYSIRSSASRISRASDAHSVSQPIYMDNMSVRTSRTSATAAAAAAPSVYSATSSYSKSSGKTSASAMKAPSTRSARQNENHGDDAGDGASIRSSFYFNSDGSNKNNYDYIDQDGKSIRSARAPSVRAPSVRAPSVRAPSTRTPSVRTESIRSQRSNSRPIRN